MQRTQKAAQLISSVMPEINKNPTEIRMNTK